MAGTDWKSVLGFEDIRHETARGAAKNPFPRIQVGNAFRLKTVAPMRRAFPMTGEGNEGKNAFLARRTPSCGRLGWLS